VRLAGEPPRRLPKHPFRDSAILYGVLSIIVVGVTALTGGDLAKGVAVAAVFFVGATAWSWWRLRERVARERGNR
jgi:hypothetical protein